MLLDQEIRRPSAERLYDECGGDGWRALDLAVRVERVRWLLAHGVDRKTAVEQAFDDFYDR